MRQNWYEGMTQPTNLQFIEYLPEELYPSFLYNAKRLLIISDFICFPQVILDALSNGIPLVTYKLDGFEEILNNQTCLLSDSYSALYNALNQPLDDQRIIKAKEVLKDNKFFTLNSEK